MENNLRLAEVFEDISVLSYPYNWSSLAEETFNSIKNDSRQIEAGDIFVAVPGFELDGHKFLASAEAAGAILAVVEKIDPKLSIPQIRVKSSRATQADLANNYYGHPSRDLRLCGITGSNGKTSTSLMYRQIIEATKGPCGLIGTVSYESGSSEVASNLTTPDSLDLERYFREMLDNGYNYAAMEVSSIALSQERVRGVDFDVAAFINLGREHLDYHGSMEAYLAEKKKLFVSLRPDAIAVVNHDDDHTSSIVPDLKSKVISFGRSEDADVRAENIDISTGFAEFDLVIDSGFLDKNNRPKLENLSSALEGKKRASYHLRLKVPGFHSVYNALAAITCSLAMGVSPEAACLAIENYGGVERRFEQVYDGEFRIFDDHFANGKNIEMTLDTLKDMNYKNLILVYAIRGKRGVTVNRENVQVLKSYLPTLRLKKFIATSSEEVVGHYDEVMPEEIAVFQEEMSTTGIDYPLYQRLDEAVEDALIHASQGDLVLLAGCQGMDAGARLALERIAKEHPDRKIEILEPIADRVCGWNNC